MTEVKTGKAKRAHYRMRNLVYLVYAPNECYHRVVRQKPTRVVLDLAAGIWMYQDFDRVVTRPIGQSGPTPKGGGVVIGVYDFTKIQHLTAMVHDTGELVRDGYRSAFDYDD